MGLREVLHACRLSIAAQCPALKVPTVSDLAWIYDNDDVIAEEKTKYADWFANDFTVDQLSLIIKPWGAREGYDLGVGLATFDQEAGTVAPGRPPAVDFLPVRGRDKPANRPRWSPHMEFGTVPYPSPFP